MSVIVDTSVWSLALRRRTPANSSTIVTLLRDLSRRTELNNIMHVGWVEGRNPTLTRV